VQPDGNGYHDGRFRGDGWSSRLPIWVYPVAIVGGLMVLLNCWRWSTVGATVGGEAQASAPWRSTNTWQGSEIRPVMI